MASVFTKWFPSGFRLIDGNKLSSWFNNPQTSTEETITAHAGGGQANAYKITAIASRVSVCATGNDSVSLPPSNLWVGGIYTIINDGAANLAVYPGNATDNIDGVGVNTAVVVGNGKRSDFVCTSAGIISSLGSSKTS